MIITDKTTIEEYAAWLSTNPKIGELKKAIASTFNYIYRAIGRFTRALRKTKTRSCLAGRLRVARTIYPLSYDSKGFDKWFAGLGAEVAATSEHIRMSELIYRRIELVEDEIGMESLRCQALEILLK